ncbi:uncharacterized protein PGTG_21329 [Puccinia graminis f. sp. tritici CRL 75-36-700-3]|uniref:Uncharacterized protein n=1 Tax=Puccinia graminis f. sp. tritici (strain CRL 75-36-700-3 / race SCCL) TaxID=418459 RepID=H6QR14_PUCGT|nr:uncharacterized protein PGTG_21329 [Puccinia graminis f. sp. tritici CRL 75-36-700-3]EHS62958.1 hypothetical protein PGTG_21329 [Puccinia graminis f. sp. tritici CRL 75-36-700-3]
MKAVYSTPLFMFSKKYTATTDEQEKTSSPDGSDQPTLHAAPHCEPILTNHRAGFGGWKKSEVKRRVLTNRKAGLSINGKIEKKQSHLPVIDASQIRSKTAEEIGSRSRSRMLAVLIGIEVGCRMRELGSERCKRNRAPTAQHSTLRPQLSLNLARPPNQHSTPTAQNTPWAPPKGLCR